MSETSAPDTGRTAEEMRAQEALALRDELMAYAAQLIRMSTQAGLGGRDLAVRVKEPEHLAHLITRAASALQARGWAAAEAEAVQLRSRLLQAEKGAEAAKWRRTGTSSHPVSGGRGVDQWFRPSDGNLQMFPTGFDPNSGTYGPTILHDGQAIYLCPGDTFVPAPDPLNPSQEAGDHEPR